MQTHVLRKVFIAGGVIASAAVMASLAFASTPTSPTGLTATAISSSEIDLSWTASAAGDASSSIVGYDIFRDGTQIATTTTTSTAYADTGLSASTAYSYAVAGYDNQGNVSAQSAAVSASTLAAPDTSAPSVPAGLAASVISSSQINLSWTASTDNVAVTGYKIYRDGVQVATATGTSYSDTGLAASTTFSYAVAAYDAAGNTSAESGTVSATTLMATTTPPVTPPQQRVKPEELSINPNGHILVHGMIVTSVGDHTFTGTIWGITYTVQYNQTNFEFLFKGGDDAATSTGQIQIGDEVGVMGMISHDAPLTIQAQIIRDYSLVIARAIPHGLLKKVENSGEGNQGNGNGGGVFNSQALRDRIQAILQQINDLQGKLHGKKGGE